MAFVQIIEFRSSRIEDILKLNAEWTDRAGSETTARREFLCEDRDDPGRYIQVVFFDSYESAMKNSELAVTHEFAEKMRGLAEGPPAFYNLNVVEHRTFDER
jgi:hypothetical protein